LTERRADLAVVQNSIQVNPNCVIGAEVGDGIMYDLRIYNDLEFGNITVSTAGLPEAWKLKKTRIYFQIDNTGVYLVSHMLFSPTFPYYISNVCTIARVLGENNL
jgi:hypothetical protein